jgi:hypothetical protein
VIVAVAVMAPAAVILIIVVGWAKRAAGIVGIEERVSPCPAAGCVLLSPLVLPLPPHAAKSRTTVNMAKDAKAAPVRLFTRNVAIVNIALPTVRLVIFAIPHVIQ